MTQKLCRYLAIHGVVLLVVSLLFVPSRAHLQVTTGAIIVTGKVKVNGRHVPNGFPIWSAATVDTTANGSSAVVSLGKLGRLDVHENSEARIEFNDTRVVVSMLAAGRVRLSTPTGVGATVRSADAQVRADTNQANEFSFDTTCGNLVVATKTGKVALRTGGRNSIVKEISAGLTETVGAPKRVGCK